MGATISYYFQSASLQSMIDYMNSYDTINYYDNNNYYYDSQAHAQAAYNQAQAQAQDAYNQAQDAYNQAQDAYNQAQAVYNRLQSQVSLNVDDNFYKLYIYVHDFPGMETIKQNYQTNAFKHNSIVENYLRCFDGSSNSIGYGVSDNDNDDVVVCFDSGFDLLCPENNVWTEEFPIYMLDHKISCAMTYNNKPVGYYLYLRSSTPIKTPLRLANNVGIIDSGYRGTITAIFDILHTVTDSFEFFQNNRYVQLTPPNIGYPMKVFIVDDLNMLGKKNNRNENGFGSSGN
jgi:dUTP pyrophosphatase